MSIVFNRSDNPTVGIEVEVQLVDRDNLGLVSTSSEIINGIKGLSGSVKHELFMSNLEINSRVCSRIEEAEEDLYSKFSTVIEEAATHNTILCCAGSHPFSSWREQSFTDDERYMRLVENLQIVARRFNIFGLHVHVGVDSGDKCIYVMNRMLYYLPHLLALSANSPFWNGDYTGLRSYRTKVFETLPTAGLPFFFENWADYSRLVESYISSGTIETIREIWWDIRPHPDFGTLELRICDTPSSIRDVLSLTALIQAMVLKLGRDYERGIPYRRPHPGVIRQNKWRAARYGIDGEFLNEYETGTVSTRDAIMDMVHSVEREAVELGSGKYTGRIKDILDTGDGASKQIAKWRELNNLKGVVEYLSEGLHNEVSSEKTGAGS